MPRSRGSWPRSGDQRSRSGELHSRLIAGHPREPDNGTHAGALMMHGILQIDLRIGASHPQFLACDKPLVSLQSRTSNQNRPAISTSHVSFIMELRSRLLFRRFSQLIKRAPSSLPPKASNEQRSRSRRGASIRRAKRSSRSRGSMPRSQSGPTAPSRSASQSRVGPHVTVSTAKRQ